MSVYRFERFCRIREEGVLTSSQVNSVVAVGFAGDSGGVSG